MPNRIIKDTIGESEKLSKCSFEAFLAFPIITTIADDWGCLKADPRTIKKAFLYREEATIKKIEGWMKEYVVHQLCYQWEDTDSTKYVYFIGWFRHQSIRYMGIRKTPPPPDFEFSYPTDKERFSSKEITATDKRHHSVRTDDCQRHPNTNTYTYTNTETKEKLKHIHKPRANGFHPFSKCEFFEFEKFCSKINEDPKYKRADLGYYYDAVKNWSESKGVVRKDWIATTRNFILRDIRDGKYKTNDNH